MKKTVSYLRKLAALLVGVPVLVLGIVLIPLPGPGFLVCFLGLFILSLEFDWIKPYRERIEREAKKIFRKAKDRSDALADKDRTRK